jgi:hypothetical protein
VAAGKAKAPPPPAVTANLATWSLPVPISQAVVLAGTGPQLLVTGGEAPTGEPASGAFSTGTGSGSLRLVATLQVGVRDASGAVLNGQEYVFGGVGTAPTAAVQAFPAGQRAPTTRASTTRAVAAPTATAAASLPRPRAGSAAVGVAGSVYIVGGWDGSRPDGQVLATSDGTTFRAVATLPVPVRDAGVAAVGGRIYVFGGAAPGPGSPGASGAAGVPTSAAGAGTWSPVSAVQMVDPATGKATVVGHLPLALVGTSGVTLGGHVYVAGGSGPHGTNATIWGLEPPAKARAHATLVAEGHLAVAVSHAGAAVVGGDAWLVGGQSASGKLVGSVQRLRLRATPVQPPAKGRSPNATTKSTSPPRS